MDRNLSRLLRRFSSDLAQTNPSDLDTLALAYMNLAYQLGRDAGRAEAQSHGLDTNSKRDSGETHDSHQERPPERK
jgi:hypothetical protein